MNVGVGDAVGDGVPVTDADGVRVPLGEPVPVPLGVRLAVTDAVCVGDGVTDAVPVPLAVADGVGPAAHTTRLSTYSADGVRPSGEYTRKVSACAPAAGSTKSPCTQLALTPPGPVGSTAVPGVKRSSCVSGVEPLASSAASTTTAKSAASPASAASNSTSNDTRTPYGPVMAGAVSLVATPASLLSMRAIHPPDSDGIASEPSASAHDERTALTYAAGAPTSGATLPPSNA